MNNLTSAVEDFNMREFRRFIDPLENYEPNGDHREETQAIRRLSLSSSTRLIHEPSNDVVLGLELPHPFAVYVNDLVKTTLKEKGLWTGDRDPVLSRIRCMPFRDELVTERSILNAEARIGFYLWRIDSVLMWQQLDRRIDE